MTAAGEDLGKGLPLDPAIVTGLLHPLWEELWQVGCGQTQEKVVHVMMKYPGLAFQAESLWSTGCSHPSCHLLCRAGRRHLLLHGEGVLTRAWDVSKTSLHGLEKVEHPREDGGKGKAAAM